MIPLRDMPLLTVLLSLTALPRPDRLMSRAREFAGEEPQADDMTCVVVRVEG